MLPTSGYFRDIVCPFLRSGLCERNHCHYRHTPVGSKWSSTSASKSKSKSLPVYVPTPVSQLKKSDTKGVDVNANSNSIPVYKPTPISVLKKKQIGTYSQSDDKTNHTSNNSNNSNVSINSNNDSNTSAEKNVKKKGLANSETKSKQNKIKDELKNKINCDKELISAKKSKSEDKSNKVNNKSKANNNGINKKMDTNNETKRTAEDMGSNEQIYETSNKKVRIAHNPSIAVPKKEKKVNRLSATQTMQQRFSASQSSNQNDQNKAKVDKADETNSDQQSNSITGKRRVAHRPIVTKRPTITGHHGNKIPLKMRQQYLNIFIDELLIFCSEENAFQRGLECEKSIFDRCKSQNLYKVISVNEVKKFRKEAIEKNSADNNTLSKQSSDTSIKLGNFTVSHEAILNGKISGTYSVEKRQKSLQIEELTDCELYKMLTKYVMNEKHLVEYGYPRVDPLNKGCAFLPKPNINKIKNNYDTRKRNCSRCNKMFNVDDNEMPLRKETCIFHSGRIWNERFNKSIERKYSCCKNDSSADGCNSNPYHIIDGFDRPDYTQNYVRTLPKKPPPSSGYFGIFGLDCEMCYTTHGLELTRVTVVNTKHETIYETLVKPEHPILDYNSKFSGIKESDLKDVTTTRLDVQTRLISLFNSKTILIGHSLESDLKALKLIHDTVIDTAQVFPHKRGLPFKRALRTLTAEFLKKIIQDDVTGHDSCEDALAALKLMLWKVNEDLKKLKR